MTKTTITHCAQGVLKGVLDDGVHTFFDIPYAVDAGRFFPALAPSTWPGERDCTRPGPVFPQLPSRLDFVMGPTGRGAEMSEDAFRLNVFTPALSGTTTGHLLDSRGWLPDGGRLAAVLLRRPAREKRARRCGDHELSAWSARQSLHEGDFARQPRRSRSRDGLAVGQIEYRQLWWRSGIDRAGRTIRGRLVHATARCDEANECAGQRRHHAQLSGSTADDA